MSSSAGDGKVPAPSLFSSMKDIDKKTGEFVRSESTLRRWIDADGTRDGFAADGNGRYHLFGSYACPWTTRTLLTITLVGLEEHIGRSVAHPNYQLVTESAKGWVFTSDYPDNSGCGFKTLREVYLKHDPDYQGKWTVPVLFDTKTGQIVNNDSGDVLQMLATCFTSVARNPQVQLFPDRLRDEVLRINDLVHAPINDGVYKCGFAAKQEPYERAARAAMAALDECEHLLSTRRFLAGDQLTMADVRLFATLIRWDTIYFVHFKCCFRRIQTDHPNCHAWLCEIWQLPGVKGVLPLNGYIKDHYYQDHLHINPHGITPIGPTIDFDAPHGRAERFPVSSTAE